MTSFRSCVVYLAVAAGVLAASPASAQSGRVTASINFGAQGGSGDFTYRQTPTIYLEPASIDIAQNYESGPLFDVGGSMTLFGNIGVGLSYSRTSGDGVASVAAQVPDTLYFDSPRGASASVDGLEHTENAVHLQVFYRFAVSPKLDVSVGIGPTFFSVKQQLIESVEVTEPTPTITPTVVKASDSPVGINVGADATYMVTKSIGAGVLLRYAGGSGDFATANGEPVSLDVGGFQFAVGLRVRF
jgi:opacity protein-like surface antigen